MLGGEACLYDYGDQKMYEFEAVERSSFLRWITSPLNCNANQHNRTACLARADVIVVPSACSACFRDVGQSGSCYQRDAEFPNCTNDRCEEDFLIDYWRRVRRHVEHLMSRARNRHAADPLILTHGFASWGDFFNRAVIRALAAQPAEFVARVVIATIEEPWGRWPDLISLFPSAVLPTFVVVPYSIHTSRIANRGSEAHGGGGAPRPFAMLFQGRVNGRWRACAKPRPCHPMPGTSRPPG